MEAVEVCRLSFNAARDDSEVTSSTNCDQSTLVAIATSGSTTNTAADHGRDVQPSR